ncbi:MAG: carbohydrate ABC transporter permease [Candidatus Caldatribacterium sp.]|nr:carbohydrate ABC transporter permease [Candidatus Caldatribacterium sp.]
MSKRGYLLLAFGVIVILIFVTLAPFIIILLTSLKLPQEITINPFGLPKKPTLFNYSLVLGSTYRTVGLAFDVQPLSSALVNTLVISLCVILITLPLGLMAAYGLSRYRVGGNFLPFWFLSLLFAPPIVFAFPLYLMYQRAGLLDTKVGLVLANLIFSLPFAIWIFYSHLREAPRDVEEAALIDGANSWTVLWRVVLPIMRSVIVAVVALVFVFTWNEFLFSAVLASFNKTVTVALSGYNTGQLILHTVISAGIAVGAIPPILILLFFEKYLVSGLSFGAIR